MPFNTVFKVAFKTATAFLAAVFFTGLLTCLPYGLSCTFAAAETNAAGLAFPFSKQSVQKPSRDNAFLKTSDAFQAAVFRINENTLKIQFDIADNYYLYAGQFHFKLSDDTPLTILRSPAPSRINDFQFGETDIFRHSVAFIVKSNKPVPQNAQIAVTFQGCSDKGLCYPVITETFPVPKEPASQITDEKNLPDAQTLINNAQPSVQQPQSISESSAAAPVFPGAFLILGIFMAFTPCVFPLAPVVLTLITGSTAAKHHVWSRLLAYAAGFIAIYACAGLVAAASGGLISRWFQSPWLLVICALVYILLGLSMFGVWSLDLSRHAGSRALDALLQTRAPSIPRGFFIGVFSGLIATPCLTPPLAASLLHIAHYGDWGYGLLSLSLLAVGLVIPLIALALFGKTIFPKSGQWLVTVQRMIGILLFAMAIWIISPLLPVWGIKAAWILWTIGLAYGLGMFNKTAKTATSIAWRIIAKIALIGAAYFILQYSFYPEKEAKIPTLTALSQVSEISDGKPVLVFFTADWCTYCPKVNNQLQSLPELISKPPRIQLVKVDLTWDTPQNKAIAEHFNVFGPPTLLLLTPAGEEIPNGRITGLPADEELLQWVKNAVSLYAGQK